MAFDKFEYALFRNALYKIANDKVDKVDGKGLSTNDYTTAEKNNLAILTGNSIFGNAEDGTIETLIDSSNEFNSTLIGKTITIIKDEISYDKIILNVVDDVITFEPLGLPVNSSATLTGSGTDIYIGSITVQAITAGTTGDVYSVEFVAGTGVSTMMSASYADNVLTITSSTDADGLPLPLYAGDIQTLIINTAGINEVFESPGEFTAGAIEYTDAPVQFEGGDDGISVDAGNPYYISLGANGTFTSSDGKTVTVSKGIIMSIV